MAATNDTNALPVGRKIEKIRRLRGMTQTELGDLLGVSKQAVSKMEQTKKMDGTRLNYIADMLGVTPEVIRTFKEETTLNFISSPLHYNPGAAFYNPDFNTIIENYERRIKEKNELIEKQLTQSNKPH
jgi:transcriptional regulator with XRE-family HTH domain